MAVVVTSEERTIKHPKADKWIVDDSQNLVIVDDSRSALAIYAHWAWSSAKVE